MDAERFDRNTRFFGAEGQAKLDGACVAVVGVGGLGTHVVQQSALLGIGGLTLVDHERLTITNLNRYVGVRPSDIGELKVELGARIAAEIRREIRVTTIPSALATPEAFEAIRACDVIVGCVDSDGPRLILNELSAAADRPYFDLATDIDPSASAYGGRVVASLGGNGCLVCRAVIDPVEAGRDLAGDAGRIAHEALYGVPSSELEDAGPAVVSLNGVVASLAMTEILAMVTGLRAPRPMLTYRGDLGTVRPSVDPGGPSCHYCHALRGKWEAAGLEKYLSAEAQTLASAVRP